MRSFRSRDNPAEHVTLKQPSANLRYLGITCTVLDFDLATSTSLQLFLETTVEPEMSIHLLISSMRRKLDPGDWAALHCTRHLDQSLLNAHSRQRRV